MEKNNIIKNVGYLFFSQILIKILGLIYSLFLINKTEFGDMGNAIFLSCYQVFGFMITFSAMGVSNSVSNSIASCQSEKEIKKVFNTALLIYGSASLILCLILFCSSNFIAENIIKVDIGKYNLKILSPCIILVTLENILIGYFCGIQKMNISSKIQLIEQFIKTIFTVFLVNCLSKITNNCEILTIGTAFSVVISILIGVILGSIEKNKIDIKLKRIGFCELRYKEIAIKLLRYSIPISFVAIFAGINKNIDSITIMNFLAQKIGDSEAQKIYGIIASKVDTLIILPMTFNSLLITAFIPNISKEKSNRYRLNYIIEKLYLCSSFIGIGGFLVMFGFSDEIFCILFPNSNVGSEFLKLSSFSILFSVLAQTFMVVLQSFEKNRIIIVSNIICTIIKIVFNFIFININFLYKKAIIFSTILSNFISFFILFLCINRVVKIKFSKKFIKIFMCTSIGAILAKVLVQYVQDLGFGIKIAFFSGGIIGIIFFLLEILIIGKKYDIYMLKSLNEKK